jgi:hypothetical protein
MAETLQNFNYRYFKQMEDEGGNSNVGTDDGETEGKEDNYYWWHKMLACYFENTDNLDRYVEVYT